jgi:hypothetical protein
VTEKTGMTDEVLELLAEERKLTRKEKSIINKAAWAEKTAQEKSEIALKSELPRAMVTTKLGKTQRVKEFKELILNPAIGKSVIRKVVEVALNDEHPGQMAALKMCIDRQLPISHFDLKSGNQRTSVQINISGIGDSPITIDNDSGEVEDV